MLKFFYGFPMKERATYPSDISREQFDAIRPKLESFRHSTKPRILDLYDIFCGILAEKWLPVANVAEGLPTLPYGLHVLPPMGRETI
jgi:hypothetical protein